MKTIDIEELKPGDVFAKDVYTPMGQLLGRAGRAATPTLILHMKYYGVDAVTIEELGTPSVSINNPHIAAILDEHIEPDGLIEKTLTYRLRTSGELAHFSDMYKHGIDSLKDDINVMVKRQGHIQKTNLINDTKVLFEARPTGIGIMSMLLFMREIDDCTYAHSINVALISRACGNWLGFSEEDLDVLTLCGLLHDIGKAMVPNEILQKTAPLTAEEFEIIKAHPSLGYELIKDEDIDERIKLACLRHHEKINGVGYPDGIKGDDIDLFAQIVTLADVYDAMTADRCYRKGMTPFAALGQMKKDTNQYNQDFLSVFIQHVADSFVGIGVELSNGARGIVRIVNVTDVDRPVVSLDDFTLLDLRQEPGLSIKRIIT